MFLEVKIHYFLSYIFIQMSKLDGNGIVIAVSRFQPDNFPVKVYDLVWVRIEYHLDFKEITDLVSILGSETHAVAADVHDPEVNRQEAFGFRGEKMDDGIQFLSLIHI